MKKSLVFVAMMVAAILFTGCADVSTICPAETDHLYGFWGGLWHGMIILWDFIGSLFSDNVAVYATNNNGGFYNFGFLLGTGSFAGLLKVLSK